jgi:hypothetical protein
MHMMWLLVTSFAAFTSAKAHVIVHVVHCMFLTCSLDDGAQLESEWWGGYFKEVDAKWQDIRPPHLVGMAVAVAQLVEDPPDRWGRRTTSWGRIPGISD